MDGIVLEKQPNITLTGILPDIQRLDILDKIKLIRILAEELENNIPIFPFEEGKTYSISTPYDSFGVGEILMETLVLSTAEE